MPEIKNSFTQGRMNKDFDERLIPNGQYRDALNIQVSTSEESNIGTVQNILGNERVENLIPASENYKCIGSIADEKNNKLYWFVTKKSAPRVDAIVEYRKGFDAKLVLVDNKAGTVDAILKFPDNIITGINLIEDMLFWTDNINEPRKINIERCKQGTSGTLNNPVHTKLFVNGAIVQENNTDVDLTEDHITVIKKRPTKAPTVNVNTVSGDVEDPLFEKTFSRFAIRYKYEDNEYSAFSPFTDIVFSAKYKEGYDKDNSFSIEEPYNTAMLNSIKSIELSDFVAPDIPKDVVQVDILYKKEDSPIVYSIASIKSTDDEFTDDGSSSASNFKGKYTVEKENIYAAVPESQLLRPWDNVPRNALAQEITGSRLIYGNYIQNYDLGVDENNNVITPSLDAGFGLRNNNDNFYDAGLPSLKSQRNYQLGVVFGDKYGRETPVFSSTDSAIRIPWEDSNLGKCASTSLQLQANLTSSVPAWADYYKFYVKETSGEYYNLVMDKAYVPTSDIDEEEEYGHIWMSFPSSDRNKITEEDFLILKKKIGVGEQQIQTDNKYKIIDVANNAPDSIKYKYVGLGSVSNTDGSDTTQLTDDILTESANRIDKQVDTLIVDKTNWETETSAEIFSNIQDTYVSWVKTTGTAPNKITQASKRYKIASQKTGTYDFKLEEKISEKDAALAAHATDSTLLDADITFKIERKQLKDMDEFSGRFFVKVVADDTVNSNIENSVTTELLDNHVVVAQRDTFWFADTRATTANDEDTGIVNSLGLGTIPTGTDAITAKNGAVTPLTNTATAWGTLETYVNNKFFIDSMYFCAGQNSPNNYARDAGSIFRGTTNQYAGIEWTNRIQEFSASNDAYAQGINSGGHRWWPFDFDDNNAAIPHTSVIVTNEDPTVNINGMDGFVKTSEGSPLVSDDGFKRWRKEGPLATVGFPNADYSFDETYGPNDGRERYFIHLSFLAPGADLVPDAIDIDGATLKGNSSLAVHLQGIWGGGVFCNETGTKLGDSSDRIIEFEGNYNDDNDPVRNSPGPGFGQGYNESYTELHNNQWNPAYPASRDEDGLIQDFVSNIAVGNRFKFDGDTDETVYTILSKSIKKIYNHTPWRKRKIYDGTSFVFGGDSVEEAAVTWAANADTNGTPADTSGNTEHEDLEEKIKEFGQADNRRICYIIEVDKDPTDQTYNPLGNADVDTALSIQFVESDSRILSGSVSRQSAIWETEAKKETDLNIYYEASDAIPTNLTLQNNEVFAPIGCVVDFFDIPQAKNGATNILEDVLLDSWDSATEITLSPGFNQFDSSNTAIEYRGSQLRFYKKDGSYVTARVSPEDTAYDDLDAGDNVTKFVVTDIVNPEFEVGLSWYNCFTFGNGIESDRIRDGFNEMQITNGAKASSTTEEPYQEEHRKHGLIYSGIYNSNSGLNELNQFIMADKITKDLNPTFGSIQKLFQRRTSLISFCEDRVVQILSNRDALFNADGNPQLISSSAVLGDATPFIGDYGISRNPESFAKESYRAYFTDKQRGAVLRLSNDGLTPISDAGMHDWFRDNLTSAGFLIGTYDEYKKDYNLTLSRPILQNLLVNADVSAGVAVEETIPLPEFIIDGGINNGDPVNLPVIDETNMSIVNEEIETTTDIVNYSAIDAGTLQSFVAEIPAVAPIDPVFEQGISSINTSGTPYSATAYDGTGFNVFSNNYKTLAQGGTTNGNPFEDFTGDTPTARLRRRNYTGDDNNNSYLSNQNSPDSNIDGPIGSNNYVNYTVGGGDYDVAFGSGSVTSDNNKGNVHYNTDTPGGFLGIIFRHEYSNHQLGKGNDFRTTGNNDGSSWLEFPRDYDDDNEAVPADVLAKFTTAKNNTIFNGEELEIQFRIRTRQDGLDRSNTNDRFGGFEITLFDGQNQVANSIIHNPGAAVSTISDPFSETLHTPEDTGNDIDDSGALHLGFQDDSQVQFADVRLNNENYNHKCYFKFKDTSLVDANGNLKDGIVIENLIIRLRFKTSDHDEDQAYTLRDFTARKIFRLAEPGVEEVINEPEIQAFPPVDIPAYTQVTHNSIVGWNSATSGVVFNPTAISTYGNDTGAPTSQTYVTSQVPLTTATALIPPGFDLNTGTGAPAALNFSDGAYTTDDKFDIDATSNDVIINQVLATPYVVGNFYLLDLYCDTAAITGEALVHGVAPSSGVAQGDQLDDHFGTVYINNNINSIKLVSTTRTSSEYGTGTDTVLRAIFKVQSGSYIANNNLLGALNLEFTDDFVGEITKVKLINISTTSSSGQATHWNMDTSALNQTHSLSLPTLYYGGNNSYSGFNWDGGREVNFINQTFTPSLGAASTATSADGYSLVFTISEAVDINGTSLGAVDGELQGFVHCAHDGTSCTGFSFTGIDTAGDYEITGNFDGSAPTIISAPTGSAVLVTSSTESDASLANQIYFNPVDNADFTGNINNISLVDITNFFSGGTASAFAFGGFNTTTQDFIQFDLTNENIQFNSAPAAGGVADGPVRLTQYIPNVLNTGETFRVKFDYTNITGELNGYYFNSAGKGFRLDTISNTGVYNQRFEIGDDNHDDSTTGIWPNGELKNTFVIYVQTGDVSGTIDNLVLQQEFPGYEPTTVTYSEDVKGWVSFKSFGGVNINGEELTLDYGVSLAKKYFTMHQGRLYEHHMQGAPRNTFYGIFVPSTLTAVLNESPSIVKIFNTLNYEGSQSKVKLFETKTTDDDINEIQETLSNINIHNSTQAKDGWAVDTSLGGYIKTDKQQGTLIEFIEKEGKWFNYIRGDGSDVKTADLSFQGLGIVTNTPTIGS